MTSWDNTFLGVCRKAMRAINEAHIRGVKTNIPFVTNILHHPKFQAGQCHTKFIDDTPELFEIENSRGQGHPGAALHRQHSGRRPQCRAQAVWTHPRFPQPTREVPRDGLKQILDKSGPEAVKQWVLGEPEEAAHHRHHHAGRPPEPALHPDAHPGYAQGG